MVRRACSPPLLISSAQANGLQDRSRPMTPLFCPCPILGCREFDLVLRYSVNAKNRTLAAAITRVAQISTQIDDIGDQQQRHHRPEHGSRVMTTQVAGNVRAGLGLTARSAPNSGTASPGPLCSASRCAPASIGTSSPIGTTNTISRGKAAPQVNVAAETSAAWIGRAVVISIIASSSWACAPSASLVINCRATDSAVSRSSPRLT